MVSIMTDEKKYDLAPVRTAIAGCGGVTLDVLDVAENHPELEFVAVQDVNLESAEKIAKRLGITRYSTDFNDLLTPDVEFVIINTPNHMHLPQAVAALEAGKHCTVQKPIGRTSDEAREMIAVAKQAGKLLGVTMEERGNVVYRQMKSMVESGCIGDVTGIEAMMAHTGHLVNPPPPDDWRAKPELIGGGSFIQLAVHHIDLAQWLISDDIIEVGATSTGGRCNDLSRCDETTVAWARFSKGALGSFTSSFACDADVFFIHGTQGYVGRRGKRISWEVNQPFDGDAWCCKEACQPGHVELEWYLSRPARNRPEFEQHRRFALAIRGVIPLETTAEDGLKDILVVEAVHKSAAEKRAIQII